MEVLGFNRGLATWVRRYQDLGVGFGSEFTENSGGGGVQGVLQQYVKVCDYSISVCTLGSFFRV